MKTRYLILMAGTLFLARNVFAKTLLYDQKGRLLQDEEGIVYTYNSDGNLLTKQNSYVKYVYHYDDQGKADSAQIFECSNGACNSPLSDWSFEFSDGKLISEIYGTPDDNMYKRTDYYYNPDGTVASKHFYSSETHYGFVSQIDYEYDAHGNVISQTKIGNDETLQTTYQYVYDKYGYIKSRNSKTCGDNEMPCVTKTDTYYWGGNIEGNRENMEASRTNPAQYAPSEALLAVTGTGNNKLSIYFK